MSAKVGATYRIQTQTTLLNLNLASERAGRRGRSQNNNRLSQRNDPTLWVWS